MITLRQRDMAIIGVSLTGPLRRCNGGDFGCPIMVIDRDTLRR